MVGQATRAWLEAKVLRAVDETTSCRSFTFDLDRHDLNSALPGQHVILLIEHAGLQHQRCYSLSNVAALGEPPQITIKRQGDGIVSNWCNDHLQCGMTVKLSLPAGEFTLSGGAGPVVLIAAGSGITPIFAMLRYILFKTGRDVTLAYVNRHPEHAIFAAELAQLEKRFEQRFTMQCWYTLGKQPVPPDFIDQTLRTQRGGDVYVCGPEKFMQRCETAAITSGVPAERVRSESFVANAPDTNSSAKLLDTRVRLMDGSYATQKLREGATLLQALKDTGQPNVGVCGGQVSCGSCRIAIDPKWRSLIPPADRREQRLLNVLSNAADGHRLACRVSLDPGIEGIEFTPAPVA
jgi:3-ketosteroid 9alpha-monooxygenase subunit B